jgi:hypothetical protein
MAKGKPSAAYPIISLFGALALIIYVSSSGITDWAIFAIFAGWWVGFYLWYEHHYKS